MKNQKSNIVAIDINAVKSRMLQIRGQQVLLDRDVAALYGVETKRVNEAVRNNPDKFPLDYMFPLATTELESLRSKFSSANLSSKSRVIPKAFTEKGLYMLATILKSHRAVEATHAIIETYAEVRAMKRELLALHTEEDAKKRNSMMRHFGEMLTDIVMPDLTTAETESSMEINFLVGKLKHAVRRIRKADESATGKDVQVRLLEARVRELSEELSNLRAMRPLRPIEV